MAKKAEIINVTEENGTLTVTYESGNTKKYAADKLPKTVIAWVAAQEKQEDETAAEIEAAEEAATTETETEEATAEQPKKVYEAQEEYEARARETAPEILAVAGIMAELKAKLEEEPEEREAKEREEKQEQEPEPEGQEPEARQEPEKSLLVAQEPGSKAGAEKIPFEGYGAAEVVGFGVMLSFALIWWIARGMMELLISALSMLIYRAWTDREKTKNAVKQIVGVAWRAAKKTVEWTAAAVRTAADNLPTAGNIKAISMIARMVILAVGLMAII